MLDLTINLLSRATAAIIERSKYVHWGGVSSSRETRHSRCQVAVRVINEIINDASARRSDAEAREKENVTTRQLTRYIAAAPTHT